MDERHLGLRRGVIVMRGRIVFAVLQGDVALTTAAAHPGRKKRRKKRKKDGKHAWAHEVAATCVLCSVMISVLT
jgi:hypothetical protein